MKRFNPSDHDKLIALITYKMFKDKECQDAFHIAKLIGLTEHAGESQNDPELDSEIKSWIELGCKVNFALLEEKGNLAHLVMGQSPFEMLRIDDSELYKQIRPFRNKASSRWSNDWKTQIKPRLIAAKSLAITKPKIDFLNLTWETHLNDCARRLKQLGEEELVQKIIDLKLEKLIAQKLSTV
jgi:hypothetical protein